MLNSNQFLKAEKCDWSNLMSLILVISLLAFRVYNFSVVNVCFSIIRWVFYIYLFTSSDDILCKKKNNAILLLLRFLDHDKHHVIIAFHLVFLPVELGPSGYCSSSGFNPYRCRARWQPPVHISSSDEKWSRWPLVMHLWWEGRPRTRGIIY